MFKPGTAVDQFSRDQTTGPGIADGKSIWEHRIVGFSSTAPGPLSTHGVVFTGGKAGTLTIDLDNTVLFRHVVESPLDGKPRVDYSNLNNVVPEGPPKKPKK